MEETHGRGEQDDEDRRGGLAPERSRPERHHRLQPGRPEDCGREHWGGVTDDGHQKVLVVDLTTGSSRVDELNAEGALGLGGKVLGIRLLEKYLDPAADPLSPEQRRGHHSQPHLQPTACTGSNRFAAFTKSPLTGIWLECYCGGTFARIVHRDPLGCRRHQGRGHDPRAPAYHRRGAEILPGRRPVGQGHAGHRGRGALAVWRNAPPCSASVWPARTW